MCFRFGFLSLLYQIPTFLQSPDVILQCRYLLYLRLGMLYTGISAILPNVSCFFPLKTSSCCCISLLHTPPPSASPLFENVPIPAYFYHRSGAATFYLLHPNGLELIRSANTWLMCPSALHLTSLFLSLTHCVIPAQFPNIYSFAASTVFLLGSSSVTASIFSKISSTSYFRILWPLLIMTPIPIDIDFFQFFCIIGGLNVFGYFLP